MLQCLDSYHTSFTDFGAMTDYHKLQNANSRWERTEVRKLKVAPLDKTSSLYTDRSRFASMVTDDAVEDTAAEKILDGSVKNGDAVTVTANDGRIEIAKTEPAPQYAMA